MCYIAAGGFSAAISSDNKSLYIWGSSTFGELEIPNRVKKISEKVQQVSIGEEFGVALTEDQKIYTWGENTNGQLGKGDFQSIGSPKQINKLTADGKVISKVACGRDFVLCLGQVEALADQMWQQNIYERKVSNVESAVMK
jgi:alpha-tubulin suppressor-like RCC1 family protein